MSPRSSALRLRGWSNTGTRSSSWVSTTDRKSLAAARPREGDARALAQRSSLARNTRSATSRRRPPRTSASPEWYTVNDLCEPEVGRSSSGRPARRPRRRSTTRGSSARSRPRTDTRALTRSGRRSTTSRRRPPARRSSTRSRSASSRSRTGSANSQNTGRRRPDLADQAAKSLVSTIVLDASDEDFNYSTLAPPCLPDLINTKGSRAFTGIPPMLLLGADHRASRRARRSSAPTSPPYDAPNRRTREPLRRLTIVLLSTMGSPIPATLRSSVRCHPRPEGRRHPICGPRSGRRRGSSSADLITRVTFRALLADPSDPLPRFSSPRGLSAGAKSLAVGQVQALQAPSSPPTPGRARRRLPRRRQRGSRRSPPSPLVSSRARGPRRRRRGTTLSRPPSVGSPPTDRGGFGPDHARAAQAQAASAPKTVEARGASRGRSPAATPLSALRGARALRSCGSRSGVGDRG